MTSLSPTETPPAADWRVYVLCAQWCGVCRDYQAFVTEQQVRAEQAWVWVDIEEHSDVLGDLDVENFPTLLVTQGHTLRFLGTVLPQPEVGLRLVQSLVQGSHYAMPDVQDQTRILQGLRQLADQPS